MINHEKYCDVWQNQEDEREKRVDKFMKGETQRTVEDWMKGLAGLENHHRSRKVAHSTGPFFGSIQRKSVLQHTDEHNQVQAAKETVSQAR